MRRPRSPPESTETGVRACSGANRKSFNVADHVLALIADRHGVAVPAGEGLDHGRRRVELSRPWSSVVVTRLAPSRTVPPSGTSAAGEQMDQRRLAGAVRADDAEAVAAPECAS